MIYFKNQNGDVFAYETQGERDEFGAADLVRMTEAEVDAHLNPPTEPVVPERVTMRQARLALLGANLLDDVEAALAALEGTAGQAARIEWEYSQEVWRNKPFVQQVASALGMSAAQLDQMFITAAGIE